NCCMHAATASFLATSSPVCHWPIQWKPAAYRSTAPATNEPMQLQASWLVVQLRPVEDAGLVMIHTRRSSLSRTPRPTLCVEITMDRAVVKAGDVAGRRWRAEFRAAAALQAPDWGRFGPGSPAVAVA